MLAHFHRGLDVLAVEHVGAQVNVAGFDVAPSVAKYVGDAVFGLETTGDIVRSIGKSSVYFSVSVGPGASGPRSLHGAYRLEDEAF